MIPLRSRNGMLLRNSNGILAADCGGPVEFSCPCTLLTGDNSDCFDTDCTPSTYIVTTTDESYCLDYVSGSTWQKTVGTRVITLNLESASETASITIVDDSVTVFSGTNTGTSCIHRWSGSMSNTITPDTIGSVSYSTECEQPEFDCDCTLLAGAVCSCFGNNGSPSHYIADFGASGKYCLEHYTECTYKTSIGSLEVSLRLFYTTNDTACLRVMDNGIKVFEGIVYDQLCHGREAASVDNTVLGSDWGSGFYYPECSEYDCINGRLVRVDIDLGSDVTLLEATGVNSPFTSSEYYTKFKRYTTVYGFMEKTTSGGLTVCTMIVPVNIYSCDRVSARYNCNSRTAATEKLGFFRLQFFPASYEWRLSCAIRNLGVNLEYDKIIRKNYNTVGYGEQLTVFSNPAKVSWGSYSSCFDFDVRGKLWDAQVYSMPGTITVSLY